MQINWNNISAQKRTSRARFWTESNLTYEDARHYADCLPEEAVLMSRKGKALGYDTFWWGGKGVDLPAIVEITKKEVQFLIMDDAEKAWVTEVEDDAQTYKERRNFIYARNRVLWRDLSPSNHEFLLSLLWIPVEPLTEMEAIAKMANS